MSHRVLSPFGICQCGIVSPSDIYILLINSNTKRKELAIIHKLCLKNKFMEHQRTMFLKKKILQFVMK